jgi:hypothetical protein
LNITVWVSVKQELILNGFGKEIEEYLRGFGEVRLDMFSNAIWIWHRNYLVNFLNKNLDFRNELDKTLWDKDNTILLVTLSSLTDDISYENSDLL